MTSLPETGFLRLRHIVGQKAITPEQAELNRKAGKRGRFPRAAIAPLIPVSATTFLDAVRAGRWPQPIKLGKATVWNVEDIRTLIEQIREGGAR